ncbi:DUF4142 domain-containing protein [Saccharibacter sp. 17.LH.SD]|uniref:DUF4142 domain-containing protein n=1 Tax=Saccharibacter sp. 17.LH.SD TaxID=2689393 RepID=UPI00136BC3DC|nr:DUF4142 domain-containing protein [Saccharibacter sp. 17.LH.SD]
MKKISCCAILCSGLLALSGCEALLTPDAPPPPPLPAAHAAPAAPPPLNLTDVAALQSINEQGLFLQAIAAMAPTHSHRDLTKNFAKELGGTYKKVNDSVTSIAKSANLSLSSQLSPSYQIQVTSLSRLYYRDFDHGLFQRVFRPLPRQTRQSIEQTKKSSNTADLKNLADSFLKAQTTMQNKARDLMKY